jgi:hypothetical protein
MWLERDEDGSDEMRAPTEVYLDVALWKIGGNLRLMLADVSHWTGRTAGWIIERMLDDGMFGHYLK